MLSDNLLGIFKNLCKFYHRQCICCWKSRCILNMYACICVHVHVLKEMILKWCPSTTWLVWTTLAICIQCVYVYCSEKGLWIWTNWSNLSSVKLPSKFRITSVCVVWWGVFIYQYIFINIYGERQQLEECSIHCKLSEWY